MFLEAPLVEFVPREPIFTASWDPVPASANDVLSGSVHYHSTNLQCIPAAGTWFVGIIRTFVLVSPLILATSCASCMNFNVVESVSSSESSEELSYSWLQSPPLLSSV